MENDSPGTPEVNAGFPATAKAQAGGLRRLTQRWVVRPSKSTWRAIAAFSNLAWRGFALGSAAALLAFAAYTGWFVRTGLGRWLDALLVTLLAAIVLALAGLLLLLLRLVLRAWPALFIVAVLAPLVFL